MIKTNKHKQKTYKIPDKKIKVLQQNKNCMHTQRWSLFCFIGQNVLAMGYSLECGWQMHWHPIEENWVSLSHQVSIASSFLVGVGSVSTLHLSLNLAGLVCAVVYTVGLLAPSLCLLPSSYWVQGLYVPVRCPNFRSGKSTCGAVFAGSGDSEWDVGKGNLTSGNNRKWDTHPCVNILDWLDGA